MEVAILRWPVEEARRRALRQLGAPRLLLVEEGPPPPPDLDGGEDWIRLPADDDDVRVRVEALAQRARQQHVDAPAFDDDGLLRFGNAWVSVSPAERRMLDLLLARFGTVVSAAALKRACWPDGPPRADGLGVHLLRLRRRIAPLGLVITNVRARGYRLTASE